MTTSIIVWDMTHRDLPVTGVEASVGVSAADGWLVSLDNRSEEGFVVVAVDLAVPDELHIIPHPLLDADTLYDTAGNMVAVANASELWIMNLEELANEPVVLAVSEPSFLKIAELGTGETVIILVEAGALRAVAFDGTEVETPQLADEQISVLNIAVDDNRLAVVFSDNATKVRVGQIGTQGFVDYAVNFTAPISEDETLLSWGYVLDEENATVVDMDIDDKWLAVTVNVTATDRLVLVDLESGQSRLLSDPKYPAHDPVLGHGLVVWASLWHLNPVQPSEQFEDHEIWYHDLSKNLTERLTEDLRDQRNPLVTEDHIIWQEMEGDKVTATKVHPRDVELQPYSSTALQLAVLVLIPLVCFHIWKRSTELKIQESESLKSNGD